MITTKEEAKHLHSLLQHKGRWYLDIQGPDIEPIMDIAEQAKEAADEKLSKLSVNALYMRFRDWLKDDNKIMPPNEHLHYAFLNDLVFDLGLSSLKGRDKDLFNESCNLTIHFI